MQLLVRLKQLPRFVEALPGRKVSADATPAEGAAAPNNSVHLESSTAVEETGLQAAMEQSGPEGPAGSGLADEARAMDAEHV